MKLFWRSGAIFFLLTAFVSGIFLINLRYLERKAVSELQNQDKRYQNLYSESTKLLLEYESLTTFSRVDSIARKEINMHLPTKSEIIVFDNGNTK